MSARTPQAIITLVILLGALRILFVWGDLPETVASHFGVDGSPDGFCSKGAFFRAYGAVMAAVLFMFVFSIALVERIPDKHLNLPHKEYWVKSGQLQEARHKVQSALLWMCVATVLLLVGLLELLVRANLEQAPLHNGGMWLLLGCFFVFELVWVFKFFMAFRPDDGSL